MGDANFNKNLTAAEYEAIHIMQYQNPNFKKIEAEKKKDADKKKAPEKSEAPKPESEKPAVKASKAEEKSQAPKNIKP